MPQEKMYEHCVDVYSLMYEHSVEREGAVLWYGKTTELFKTLNLASSYYSKILTALKTMGCIEQVQRGGGTAGSIWALYNPPKYTDFELTRNNNKESYLSAKLKATTRDIAARQEELEIKFDKLEQKYNSLAIAVHKLMGGAPKYEPVVPVVPVESVEETE